MDDADLYAAIRGTAAPKAAAPAPQAAYDPEDALIRTVAFETKPNASKEERRAVAAVIANRAHLSGKSYTDVVQEPGQFEPWAKRRKEIDAFTPDNPRYAQIKGDVADILTGADPTGGATHFYSPTAQAALAKKDGRPEKPEWDDGTGVDIGDTRFIRGTYGKGYETPDADIVSAIRGDAGPGTIPLAAPSEGAQTSAKPGQTVNQAQQVAFTKLGAAKAIDQLAPKGSVKNPYAQVDEGDTPDEPGAYFIDLKGKLQRTPGGETDANDVKTAYEAGDHKKASKLAMEMIENQQDALGAGALSGFLLGGKNEAGAILQHPLDFVTGGGINAPSIQASIGKLDARDAVREANHPYATNFGRGLGAVTGGALISAATGGAADAPLAFRVPMAALEGGAVGGAQGYLAGDGTNAQRLPGAAQGAKFGAMLGPGGEIAGDAGRYVGNKLLGLAVSPETAALAKAARDNHGIDLRGGQIADSHFVKFMDSVLNRTPGTGYASKSAAQSAQFTRAVAKTFGEDADGLTPQVMARARKRIGDEFDRVGAATTIKDAAQLGTDLDVIVSEAGKTLPKSEVTILKGRLKDIKTAFKKDAAGNLELSGESYQALTRKDTPLDRLTKSSDPNVRHYAQAMKDELLNAVQRNASVDDVAALKLARSQWAKMKTVEGLAEKAGPEGEISPALLLQAMRSNYDNLAYDGGGSLGELAKIGQRFLKEPPSSGTAERLAAQKLIGLGGAATAGGGALWLAQHPEEAGKIGLGAGALTLGTLAAGKGAAVMFDNPVYRAMLMRSANRASSVGGKPLLLSAPVAAMASNRFLTGAPTTAPAAK